MKTLKKQFKLVALVLSMLILIQGCTVYKKANVTMEVASKEHVKTKIQTINGNLIFKYIIFENDNYYGIKRSKGDLEKTRLVKESIESIQLINKPMTTIITIVIPIGVIVGVSAILLQDLNNFNF